MAEGVRGEDHVDDEDADHQEDVQHYYQEEVTVQDYVYLVRLRDRVSRVGGLERLGVAKDYAHYELFDGDRDASGQNVDVGYHRCFLGLALEA